MKTHMDLYESVWLQQKNSQSLNDKLTMYWDPIFGKTEKK